MSAFYRHLLCPDEQQLLDSAPSSPDLNQEIPLIRARLARLSPSTDPKDVLLTVRLLEVLARIVGVQSRLGAFDPALAEFSEQARRRFMGEDVPSPAAAGQD